MKTSSRKAKGRRLQNDVVKLLMESFSELEEGDCRGAIMGESGADIKMSPLAKRLIPYSFECKNQEKLNIWSSLKQAEDNTVEGTKPVLAFKRNRSDTYVALKIEDFIELIKK